MPIFLLQGDITKIKVDAIINAANTTLSGGGGVDGAIHMAGGPTIMEECRLIGGCPTGQAVITNSGNLPARKIIHTVGPVWSGGMENEAELLSATYFNSLSLALKHQLLTIAFPNISTGIYGFPKKLAAEIAVKKVTSFLKQHPFLTVYFVCFDSVNYNYYQQLLP